MQDAALLAVAGLLAGAMNAIAGDGSFVRFPAMVAAGLPAVTANASSIVALVSPGPWPAPGRGSAAGHAGARLTQWLPAPVVRGFIVALTATVTVAFSMRAI